MVSAFTPNVQIEEPARGDDVGTWDTPVNNNMTLLDLLLGGTATISLNNSNIVLSAAQFQCQTITFNSTLTASVTITFPTSFKKPYIIQNLCTGSSVFSITLATTAAGGQVIGCPPGQPFDMINDGANIKFKNFGPHIGGYWDYAGAGIPAWLPACSVPPFLHCDGSAFSSATYPVLATILGGTTLPDARGRVRAALNEGTNRITPGGCGINGDQPFSAGGDQSMQAHTHNNVLNDLGHTHNITGYGGNQMTVGSGPAAAVNGFGTTTGGNNSTPMSITNASAGAGGSQNVQPTYVGGLTFVRAG